MIHKTAIVSPKAEIDPTAEIGPNVVIEPDVKIAKGVRILHNAYICSGTEIGENTYIHMGAVIGHEPQDHNYKGEKSFTKIGKDNLIREYVTIHRATGEGLATTVGNHNMLMAQCHLGHNCEIQDNTIIANSALLSGYVKVEPYAFISGNVVVHQFCRIGRLSMSGGFTGVNKDVPPYMIVRGPSAIRSINLVGLRRAGKSREVIRELMEVFKLIYMSDLRMDDVLKKIKEECKSQEAQEIAVFIEQSKRGICKYRYSREEYFE